MYNMKYTTPILLLITVVYVRSKNVKKVIELEGDVKIAFFVDSCQNYTGIIPYTIQSFISSALWTIERVNFLELLSPLKLGLEVYEICTERDYYRTIFALYDREDDYVLGIIEDRMLGETVYKLSEVLNIKTIPAKKYCGSLVKASVLVLSALGWVDNVTIVVPNENIAKEFFAHSKKEAICVTDCTIYGGKCPILLNISTPFVFFGSKYDIESFTKNSDTNAETNETLNGLFVPLDGSVPTDLPEKSYVIIPPHSAASAVYQKPPEIILATPTFFEVAKPILTYTKNIEAFIRNNCNETIYKVNCLRNKFNKKYQSVLLNPSIILDILRIEPMKNEFVYDVYRVENDTQSLSEIVRRNNFYLPYTKMFTYNLFDSNLSIVNTNFEMTPVNSSLRETSGDCISFSSEQNIHIFIGVTDFSFRSEAWVYAFLSLSLLGVLFCISVLIFLIVCICKRDILEGNPILTLALLVAVMCLFCSVLPFSLETTHENKNILCLAKSLSITLSYALVFSLLLSRCILLATSSKEIGFMSHIAGPVQSFMCLFIFGVQAALSLQIIGRCLEIFRGHSFIFLMSYNTMLLLLLLCLCPLIYKCQRNYREGKYFVIAIIMTTCVWCIWLPMYALLEEEWKEPILCLGLVTIAAIFLGAIFIPRTYLMTIAAARNKITSALPSMTTATSTIDIYRANTQPIYDCVNIAAINAVAVARAGVNAGFHTTQTPDLYSCPVLPDDEEFDFRCDTPTSTDKVTRF